MKVLELIKSICLFVCAAYIYQPFAHARNYFMSGGLEISRIQSVGGKTLEEAYYHELGTIYNGFAELSHAFGIVCIILFLYLAITSLQKAFIYDKKIESSEL